MDQPVEQPQRVLSLDAIQAILGAQLIRIMELEGVVAAQAQEIETLKKGAL